MSLKDGQLPLLLLGSSFLVHAGTYAWRLMFVEVKYKYLIPCKKSTVLSSNLMRLYSPVDLTGNLILIEQLVLGGTWNGDLTIISLEALIKPNICAIKQIWQSTYW